MRHQVSGRCGLGTALAGGGALGLVLGLVLAVIVLLAAGGDRTYSEQATDGTVIAATIAAAVPMLPALVQGVRAAVRGGVAGALAAIVGGLLLVVLALWIIS
jgi:hypothetical protein